MTVYAFDADTFVEIWSLFIGQAATWGTQAPAIDPVTKYIYGVYKNDNVNGYNYLIGIDILTGKMLPGSPLLINATVAGVGVESVNGQLPFANTVDPASGGRLHSDCRSSLLIVNSVIYFGFGTFADTSPYHGWAFGYHYDTTKMQFTQVGAFCITPNGRQGGIWGASQGFASDGTYVYLTTGNGDFDATHDNYAMAAIKLTLELKVVDYFVPALWQSYSRNDWDLGGCGLSLLPNSPYVIVGITKYGAIHLVDINNMGKFNATQDACHQTLSLKNGAIFPGGNLISWNTGTNVKVYGWAPHLPLTEITYNPTTALLESTYVSWAASPAEAQGLCISSNGKQDPILWAWGQAGLFAFDASKDISAGPIWSTKLSGPTAWSWPLVVNGKVYVSDYDNYIYVYGP